MRDDACARPTAAVTGHVATSSGTDRSVTGTLLFRSGEQNGSDDDDDDGRSRPYARAHRKDANAPEIDASGRVDFERHDDDDGGSRRPAYCFTPFAFRSFCFFTRDAAKKPAPAERRKRRNLETFSAVSELLLRDGRETSDLCRTSPCTTHRYPERGVGGKRERSFPYPEVFGSVRPNVVHRERYVK